MAPPVPLGPEVVRNIENTADSLLLKFSYTPYPFVTFFAVGGRVDGHVDVSIIPPIGDITVDYDGWVYGGGMALSYAYRHYFATVTGSYTMASLNRAEIDTLVVLPRVGLFNEKGAVWLGAQYHRTEHSQSGSLSLALPGPTILPVSFNVDLEDEAAWSTVVGGRWNFADDRSLTVEAGVSGRKQVMVFLERKF